MSHTPGEWKYLGPTGDGKRQLVESTNGDSWERCSVEVDSDDCDYDMAVANARLIAASPKLLEACERTLEILDAWGPERRGHTLELLHERLTAAIAAATKENE